MYRDPSYFVGKRDRPRARLYTDGEFSPALQLGADGDPVLRFNDTRTAVVYLCALADEAAALAETLKGGRE